MNAVAQSYHSRPVHTAQTFEQLYFDFSGKLSAPLTERLAELVWNVTETPGSDPYAQTGPCLAHALQKIKELPQEYADEVREKLQKNTPALIFPAQDVSDEAQARRDNLLRACLKLLLFEEISLPRYSTLSMLHAAASERETLAIHQYPAFRNKEIHTKFAKFLGKIPDKILTRLRIAYEHLPHNEQSFFMVESTPLPCGRIKNSAMRLMSNTHLMALNFLSASPHFILPSHSLLQEIFRAYRGGAALELTPRFGYAPDKEFWSAHTCNKAILALSYPDVFTIHNAHSYEVKFLDLYFHDVYHAQHLSLPSKEAGAVHKRAVRVIGDYIAYVRSGGTREAREVQDLLPAMEEGFALLAEFDGIPRLLPRNPLHYSPGETLRACVCILQVQKSDPSLAIRCSARLRKVLFQDLTTNRETWLGLGIQENDLNLALSLARAK